MPHLVLETLRGPGRREDVVPVPKFGDECVCCNQPSNGGSQHLVPSSPGGGGRVMKGGLDVPVCEACRDHATLRFPVLMPTLIGLGIVTIGLAATYGGAAEAPAMILGVAMLVGGIAWLVVGTRRERRERRREGHFPGLNVTVLSGTTRVWTRNPALVDRVRLINPDVRVVETWLERKARGTTAMPRPSEAATATLVQHVAASQLDAARALLATGTVDPIEAQRLLAELETVLGTRGLQARLEKLLLERPVA